MKAGTVKVGDRVRVIESNRAYPELRGTTGVVVEIIAQNADALEDAVLYQPIPAIEESSEERPLTYPLSTSSLQLL